LDSGIVSVFIGIVPEGSRRFRSGTNMGPLVGGLCGPKGKCPEGRGETCPPLFPLGRRPRAWRRGQGSRPAPHIRRGKGVASLHSNPSRHPTAAPPPLSLATVRRRSPVAETLHHKHHAVMLQIQSISPPYLLDQGRRRRRYTIHVYLSEAPPLAA
jgi:hypothetical protein